MRRLFPLAIFIFFLAGLIWAQDLTQRREALRELTLRAEDMDPKALFDLARLHESGYDSIEVDSARSHALYLLSAAAGYAPARNIVGFKYYNGEGFRHDIDSALYWINLAAETGDLTAISNLGFLLSQSEDIPHDYARAKKYLTIAAEGGVPSALSQLGDFKRMGLGEATDTAGAIRLYEEAAEAGVPDAQLKLLAMMGHKWKELPSDSALKLGIRYYTGALPVAGVDLLERAALDSIPKALALLGDAYSRGVGVAYDHQKSIDYFYAAALKGDHSAQFILAELLDFFPDAIEAGSSQYLHEQAAKGGILDADSAYNLLFSLP